MYNSFFLKKKVLNRKTKIAHYGVKVFFPFVFKRERKREDYYLFYFGEQILQILK